MEIRYTMDQFRNTGFFSTPDEQDGYPPVGSLTTNLAPTYFSGGRRGLACSFSFSQYTAGKLSFNSKVSPLTAGRVQALMPSTEVFVDTNCIEFKPTDMQLGEAVMHVLAAESISEAGAFADKVSRMEGNNTFLCILKNDGTRGYLSSPRGRIVASNYWLRKELSTPVDALFSICALALMYSEDLRVGRIRIHNAPQVEPEILEKVGSALYSVGISLAREEDA